MIKINPNCRNGEHSFIPAVTHVDGRDNIVTSLVCQHCLYYVNEDTWFNHLQEHYKIEPKEALPTAGTDVKPVLEPVTSSVNKKPTQSYAGKRRGPKPKAQGKIQGLDI